MSEEQEDEAAVWQSALKWGLIGVGGLTAIGLLKMMWPLVLLTAIGGAGFWGMRWLKSQKLLPEGSSKPKALKMSNDDFEAKMRELDALEKRYDREID